MRNSRPVIALALLAGLLAVGCTQPPPTLPESRTIVVEPHTFERVIREAGLIEATRVVSIIAPDRAKLLLLPETGTMVRKGDPVMVLDTTQATENLERTLNELEQLKTELEANIETLKIAMRENLLDLDLAESELAYSTVKLEDTKVKLAETELLLQRSVVPEDDLRTARSDARSGELDAITNDLTLRSQETAKASAELDNLASISQKNLRGDRLVRRVMDAKAEIDAATMYAEVSGIFVRSRNWSWRQRRMEEPRPGDEVREGQRLGQIPDLDSLVVRTQIPEEQLTGVEVGAPAYVVVDALGGRRFEATIQSIGRVAIAREASAGGSLVQTDTYSGQKVFEIVLDLAESDERLRPGLTAQVGIVVEREEQVLAVPIDAVRRDDGRFLVDVVGADGVATPRAVTLGARSDTEVVVTSGLRAGDRVARTNAASGQADRRGMASNGPAPSTTPTTRPNTQRS